VVGVIPPALIALLQGGPGLMVAVIVVYCVLNFVVQTLIQPRFVGDSVGLSVTVTFLVLFIWTWLIGPLGAVLAIPLTLLVKALLVDIDPGASWADALLRDRPIAAATPAGQQDDPAAVGSVVSKDLASAASKDGAGVSAARKDGVVVDVQSDGSPAGSGAAAGAQS